jgi:4a-hydroxytetrahydrobiopterin dehydratase
LPGRHAALGRQITFKTFECAMAVLNRLAEVAECEGYHPDLCLQGWNQVSLALQTHAIGGLVPNDFVLAAKLQMAYLTVGDEEARQLMRHVAD